MSVFRQKNSPYFHFDFQLRGHRFHGSMKCTTKREAEKVETAERDKAKLLVGQIESARTSLLLDDVAGRCWSEHTEHLASAPNAEGRLALLIQFFGKDKLITDIVDDDVTKLVAWRRGHRGKSGALISPYTVNHTTEQLRELFTSYGASASSTSRTGASTCSRCHPSGCVRYRSMKPTRSMR